MEMEGEESDFTSSHEAQPSRGIRFFNEGRWGAFAFQGPLMCREPQSEKMI